MHFFYIVLISIANNLDNIGVRIAYSLRGIKISIQKNFLISFITFIVSSTAAFLGSSASDLLNKKISSYVCMFILIIIGLWIIIGNRLKKDKTPDENTNIKTSKNPFTILEKPECADLDNSKEIDFKEAILLGFALSLDNVGGGLSAGMIGLNPFFVGIVSAVISFLALFTANYLSSLLNRFNFGNKATLVAGIVIILIGIKQIL